MTQRERILAVYRGEQPDQVPYMLDLSHWYYHRHHLPWDLSRAYETPEHDLIDYHRQVGAGFYMPNLGLFYNTEYDSDVKVSVSKRHTHGTTELLWRVETPVGTIERARRWEKQTYAWGISRWGITNAQDLRAFGYAMSRRRFLPRWDLYSAWVDAVGDNGVVYLSPGYSAAGHLLHYWMGIEQFVYATVDYPEVLAETIDAVNANTLELVDLLAESPADIIVCGDNFSSDIQPPAFFDRWSRPYYTETVRRLHGANKYVAVHIDGKLRNAIRMIASTGADCGDAITPVPLGDLTSNECRAEAGVDFILSGGVSPNLWLPTTPIDRFTAAVHDWLATRVYSSRLIAGAGDQVPPGADENRIKIMRDLIEEHGRY